MESISTAQKNCRRPAERIIDTQARTHPAAEGRFEK
jgi:hypothetical protein